MSMNSELNIIHIICSHDQLHADLTVSTASGHEIITYEEVVKIDPQVDRPRPILIIGKLMKHALQNAS